MKTTELVPALLPPGLVKQLDAMHEAEAIRKQIAELRKKPATKLNRKQRRALASRSRRK